MDTLTLDELRAETKLQAELDKIYVAKFGGDDESMEWMIRKMVFKAGARAAMEFVKKCVAKQQ